MAVLGSSLSPRQKLDFSIISVSLAGIFEELHFYLKTVEDPGEKYKSHPSPYEIRRYVLLLHSRDFLPPFTPL